MESVLNNIEMTNNVLDESEKLPISNISKMMRAIVDKELKISLDAKNLVVECVTEFICFIMVEAGEKCKKEKRRRVSASDIITVMKRLGFDNYVVILKLYHFKYKQAVEGINPLECSDFEC